MALTATVTQIDVNSSDTDDYTITLNLKVNDGTSDVVDQDFSNKYRKFNNFDSLKEVEKRFIKDMQKVIDNFKQSDTQSKSVDLATSVTNIQKGLTL